MTWGTQHRSGGRGTGHEQWRSRAPGTRGTRRRGATAAGRVAAVAPYRPRAVVHHGAVEEDGGLLALILGTAEICTAPHWRGRTEMQRRRPTGGRREDEEG
jgi:hypothetical protein